MANFFSAAKGALRFTRRCTRRSSCSRRGLHARSVFSLAAALFLIASGCDLAADQLVTDLQGEAPVAFEVAPRSPEAPLLITGRTADIAFEQLDLAPGEPLRASLTRRRKKAGRPRGNARVSGDSYRPESAPSIGITSEALSSGHAVRLDADGLAQANAALVYVRAGSSELETAWEGSWRDAPALLLRDQPRSVHYVEHDGGIRIVFDYHGGGSIVEGDVGPAGIAVDFAGYQITAVPAEDWSGLKVDGFSRLVLPRNPRSLRSLRHLGPAE